MGCETDLYTTLVFSHKTFNDRYDVESELDDTLKLIKLYENKLQTIGIMTEPKKYCGDDDDPLSFINAEISDALKELDDLYVERYKLNLALETWDKAHDKNGYAIRRPKNVPWDAAYLEGNFIKQGEEDL